MKVVTVVELFFLRRGTVGVEVVKKIIKIQFFQEATGFSSKLF